MNSANPILFYFDYISPFSYLASRLIEDLASKHQRQTDWRCISVNQVFRELEATPPGIAPRKSTYTFHDFTRQAEYYGIPVRMPDVFPVACGPLRQAFYHIKANNPAQAKAFAAALLTAYWSQGINIGEPEGVLEAVADTGIDADLMTAAMANTKAKQQVKQEATDAAVHDLFGVPFMVVDGRVSSAPIEWSILTASWHRKRDNDYSKPTRCNAARSFSSRVGSI